VANGNLVLNSSGNLGVGISSPTQRLHVVAAGGYNATFSENSANNVRLQFYIDANEAALVSGYNTTPKPITFYTGGGLRATLDTAGNLGLGTTPSAWGGLFDVIQMGTYGQHIAGQTNTADIKVGANNYYNGTNYVYTVSGIGAAQYNISGSTGYQWQIAGSGTAGNTITFTQAMTLDASGNLLLGTTTQGGSSKFTLQQSTDSTAGGLSIFASNGSGGAVISRLIDGGLTFRNGGLERARITESGNFGIGTASPTTNLTIGSTGGNELGIFLYRPASTTNFLETHDGTKTFIAGTDSTNGFVKVGSLSNHPVAIVQANGAAIYIDSSKNVGMGRTDPPMRFSAAAAGAVINGTATIGSNMQGIQVYNTTTATTNNAVGIWFPTGPHQAGIASFRSAPDSGWDTVLAFYTHGAVTSGLTDCYERMRITGEGNLLVGTTSEMFSARIVVGCASGSESIAFGISSNVTRASGTKYGFSLYRDNTNETNAVTFVENASSGNNAASYVVRTNAATGGSTVTSVSGGVALVNGATSWSSYSDLRLKHDVVPVTNALDSILKIDSIFFKWNDRPADQQRSIGVSAQSVEKVFPELIDRSGIYDVEGGAMQVRYTELIPVLLAAIQELKAELDSVKSELATIKGAA
jgi:hypothetical protein